MDIGSGKPPQKVAGSPESETEQKAESDVEQDEATRALNRHVKATIPEHALPDGSSIFGSDMEGSPISSRSPSPYEEDISSLHYLTDRHQHLLCSFYQDFFQKNSGCLRSDTQALISPAHRVCHPSSFNLPVFQEWLGGNSGNSRAALYYIAHLYASGTSENRLWAMTLLAEVINIDPVSPTAQFNCWQAMQAVANRDQLSEKDWLRTLNVLEGLSVYGHPMGAWLDGMVKLGFVKGHDQLDTTYGVEVLMSRVKETMSITRFNDQGSIPFADDPVSFSALDLLPRIKAQSLPDEFKERFRQIKDSDSDDFRHLFLPWVFSLIHCVQISDFRPEYLTQFLDGSCPALPLITPCYAIHNALITRTKQRQHRYAILDQQVEEAISRLNTRTSRLSRHFKNQKLINTLEILQQDYQQFKPKFSADNREQVSQAISYINQILEDVSDPFFRGMLLYYKGQAYEMGLITPDNCAAECYQQAAAESPCFNQLLERSLELHLDCGNLKQAAVVADDLARYYQQTGNEDKAAQTIYDGKTYLERANELVAIVSEHPQEIVNTAPAPEETSASSKQPAYDTQWLPSNDEPPSSKSKRKKKLSKKASAAKKNQKKLSPKVINTPLSRGRTFSPTGQEVFTEKPIRSPSPETVTISSPATHKRRKKAGSLLMLLPQNWSRDIHSNYQTALQLRRDEEYIKEGRVLEKGIARYAGQPGVERLHEEFAWHLLGLQRHPDLMRVEADHYKEASKVILDEAEEHLMISLNIKLRPLRHPIPVSASECMAMAEELAKLLENEQDRLRYLKGVNCIIVSLGHVRRRREDVVSRTGEQSVAKKAQSAYAEKMTSRTKGRR